jgi:hypothetical protein
VEFGIVGLWVVLLVILVVGDVEEIRMLVAAGGKNPSSGTGNSLLAKMPIGNDNSDK